MKILSINLEKKLLTIEYLDQSSCIENSVHFDEVRTPISRKLNWKYLLLDHKNINEYLMIEKRIEREIENVCSCFFVL